MESMICLYSFPEYARVIRIGQPERLAKRSRCSEVSLETMLRTPALLGGESNGNKFNLGGAGIRPGENCERPAAQWGSGPHAGFCASLAVSTAVARAGAAVASLGSAPTLRAPVIAT